MTFYAKTGTFNLPLPPSNITVSGVGFTPKVLLFYWSGVPSTIDQNFVTSGHPYAELGFGFGSDTEGVSMAISTRHNSDSSNNVNINNIEALVGYTIGQRKITSFNSDGFVLANDYDNSYPTRVNYLALGGTDITNVRICTQQSPTSTGQYVATGVGFQPDVVFILNANSTSLNSTTLAPLSFGMATAQDEQGVIGIYNSNPTTVHKYSYNGEVVASPSTTITNRQSFVQFHPSGFVLDKLEGTVASQNFYMAIRGGNYKVGNFNTRADYEIITVSGLGFMPDALIFSSVNNPLSTQDVVSPQANISMGTGTTTSERITSAIHILEGATPTRSFMADYNNEIYVNIYSGGVVSLGDLYSISYKNGFMVNMDDPETASGNAIIFLALGKLNQPSFKTAYTLGSGYIVVPDSDIATSGIWKNEEDGSVLYTSLSDSNDSTFVWTDSCVPGDYFEVGLAEPAGTPSGAHILVWRAYKKAGDKETITIKCELRQTSTVIASDTKTISSGVVYEFARELTTEEIANITDYAALRVRCTVQSS